MQPKSPLFTDPPTARDAQFADTQPAKAGSAICRGGTLFNVQALRAIAALLVVVVHLELLGAALGIGTGPDGFGRFAAGVDLFFVISGFIMVHTTTRRPVGPGGFLLNRLVRIAPLYWLLTFAVFAMALLVPALFGGTRAESGALLRSLAFIPFERADGVVRPILFVGWSLNLEMAFYVVFAGALAFARPVARVLVAGAVLLVAVMIGRLAGAGLPAELRFLTQPILLEFVAGMVIALFHERLPASRRAARIAVLTGLGALVVLVAGQRDWALTSVSASITVMAALVAERGGIVLGWRPLQRLGDASYALYLVHPFVTQAVTFGARHSGLLDARTAPAWMVAAMAGSVVAGLLVHRHVEVPLGKLCKRIIERGGVRERKALPVEGA